MHLPTRVTLRIETMAGERLTTIKLIGRIRTEDLGQLRAQFEAFGVDVVVDLAEVSLVNLEVIRFLCTSESEGVRLVNCAGYIRRWIDKERRN